MAIGIRKIVGLGNGVEDSSVVQIVNCDKTIDGMTFADKKFYSGVQTYTDPVSGWERTFTYSSNSIQKSTVSSENGITYGISQTSGPTSGFITNSQIDMSDVIGVCISGIRIPSNIWITSFTDRAIINNGSVSISGICITGGNEDNNEQTVYYAFDKSRYTVPSAASFWFRPYYPNSNACYLKKFFLYKRKTPSATISSILT